MNTNTIKAVAHRAHVEARKAHQGVINRAQTIPNKRALANRQACRKGGWS